MSEKLAFVKDVADQLEAIDEKLGTISNHLDAVGRKLNAFIDRFNAVITGLGAAINLLNKEPAVSNLALEFEPYNFRVDSSNWEKITIDGNDYLQNPEGDVWEILDGACAGEQLFTWHAAMREVAKAGKRVPTDGELWKLLATKNCMPNVAFVGRRDFIGLFIDHSRFAYIWSSSESSNVIPLAWACTIFFDDILVCRNVYEKKSSLSVRCVKLSQEPTTAGPQAFLTRRSSLFLI